MPPGGRELRRAKRTRRRNAAWIGIGNGRTHIPCVLWDISETGARLAAPRSKTLPAAFKLILAKDGSSHRACRVVWRNDKQLGVQFIEADADDLETAALQRQAPAVPSEPSAAAAALLLSGYGPHLIDQPARRGIRLSSLAAVMLFMLTAATVLFAVAGMHSAFETPWAIGVCDAAANFCRHPEWTGVAGALMAVVYLTVRGMEI
jgi:hypothetical protein